MMCAGETFVERLTVKDEWQAGGDKYRLVNLGAGPDQLQIYDTGEWREETQCYRWSTMSRRITELKDNVFKEFFKAILEDEELYCAYQANIAMAFYDEYRRTGNNLSHGEVHEVANRAAKSFLNMLIKD